MRKAIRNTEIARILNISPTAVSLALNDRPGVSPSTRAKVHELKYGSSLNTSRELECGNILFLIHKKHGLIIGDTPFFMALTETIQQNVTKAGYSLKILYVGDKGLNADEISTIVEDDTQGILLLATELDYPDLESYKLINKPIVLLDTWFSGADYDSVLMDNYSGVYQSLKCAAEYGHHKVGFIRSDIHCNNFTERCDAFMTYAPKFGLSVSKDSILITSADNAGIVSDLTAVLKKEYGKKDFPSLFICSNDVIALGLINAVTSCGLRIPEDVSIIGFDDMPVSANLPIPLTSVHIDHKEIGYQAVNLLMRRIRDDSPKSGSIHIQVGVDLIERSSVSHLV